MITATHFWSLHPIQIVKISFSLLIKKQKNRQLISLTANFRINKKPLIINEENERYSGTIFN